MIRALSMALVCCSTGSQVPTSLSFTLSGTLNQRIIL
jgi:hypothetical protein